MNDLPRTIVAVATAQAGKEAELKRRIEGVARASWDEPGVLTYAVHELEDQPGRFMMVEVYKSDAAFQSHLDSDHVTAFIADWPDLVTHDLEVFEGKAASFAEGEKGLLRH
jgi:quinol monooxygenase YgiN